MNQGMNPGRDQKFFFLFSKKAQTASAAHPVWYLVGNGGAVYPEIKHPRREAAL
jgi:hypothetical protein